MKKWSLIVAGLYGLVFLFLIGPLAWIAFVPKHPDLSDSNKALLSWQLWAIVAVMVGAQFALLRIPVQVANGRPVAQRSIWATIIAAAFMMGLLVLGAAASIYEFLTKLEGDNGLWLAVALALASWIFWAIYFHRSTKDDAAEKKMTRFRLYMWSVQPSTHRRTEMNS